MNFSSVKTKKLLHLFKTCRRRRGLEGEEHGPKTEPAILSVEVSYAAFLLLVYVCYFRNDTKTTSRHETKLAQN